MNKKAQESMFFDIYPALIFCVIGVIVWLLILRYDSIGSNSIIEEQKKNVGNEDIFFSLLKIKDENIAIGDYLQAAILNDDTDEFEKRMDKVLTDIYGNTVCWKLFVDDNSFINFRCATDSKTDLLDSTVIIPSADNQVNKVKLVVTGFKK